MLAPAVASAAVVNRITRLVPDDQLLPVFIFAGVPLMVQVTVPKAPKVKPDGKRAYIIISGAAVSMVYEKVYVAVAPAV